MACRLLSSWFKRLCVWLHRQWHFFKRACKHRREWWRWQMTNLQQADHRLLWMLALAHMVVLALMAEPSFASERSARSSLWYRAVTPQVLALSEGLLVHRAMKDENRGDLLAAGAIAALLGCMPMFESARLEPPVEPPAWAALTTLFISAVFISLLVILYSSFGWRRFMLFGSDPTRRALFDRLLAFHTLLAVDLLCGALLVLVVLDEAATLASTPYAGLVSVGGATALALHAMCDGLLLAATRTERRQLVLLAVPFGIASVVWMIYAALLSLSLSSGHTVLFAAIIGGDDATGDDDGATGGATMGDANVSAARGALNASALPAALSDSDYLSSRMIRRYQFATVVCAGLLRLALLQTAVRVARRVFGADIHVQQHKRIISNLPAEFVRELPPDKRRAIETIACGQVLDLLYEKHTGQTADGSRSTSGHPRVPSGSRRATSRAAAASSHGFATAGKSRLSTRSFVQVARLLLLGSSEPLGWLAAATSASPRASPSSPRVTPRVTPPSPWAAPTSSRPRDWLKRAP